MYLAVQKVCELYQVDWAGNVAFANAAVRLKDKLLLIRDIVEVQETPITGVRKNKELAREAMRDVALLVSGAVTAYATSINDQRLKDAVHFTSTDLMRVRDTLASERARVIHDQAQAVITNLADFGVTGSTLAELIARIEEFEGLLVAPRVAIVDKKGATGSLKMIMSETDALLKDEMDTLMPAFKTSAPAFYDAYFNARLIVDTGSTKPSVLIFVAVSDAQSGMPLVDVNVLASVEGSLNKTFAGTAQPDGRIRVALPGSAIGDLANVYLTASKVGYEQALKTVAVLPRTEYNVEMALMPTPVEA